MNIVWSSWLLLIVVTFAICEGYALKTGHKTLSRYIWELSKAWPPFPWVAGVLTGFLACHFWWIGMACDMVGK